MRLLTVGLPQTIAVSAMLALVSIGAAQRPTAMPVRDTTRFSVGRATLEVDYDAMVGNDSVLIGRVIPLGTWQMGSIAPARLVASSDLVIDQKLVPAGTYSLWVVVTSETAALMVNRDRPTAGMTYNSSHDVARVPLSMGRTDSVVPRFRVRVNPAPRSVATVRSSYLKRDDPDCPKFFQCFRVSIEPTDKPDATLLFEWQWLRWSVAVRFVPDSMVNR